MNNKHQNTQQLGSLTANNGFGDGSDEESKGLSPPMSKDIGDILEDLQNNQLQIYALWSEESDVHRSFI